MDLHLTIDPYLATVVGPLLPSLAELLDRVRRLVAAHPPKYSHTADTVRRLQIEIRPAPISGDNGPQDPDRVDGLICMADGCQRSKITMFMRPDKCVMDLVFALGHELAHLFSFPVDDMYARFEDQPYSCRPSERYADMIAGKMMSAILAEGTWQRDALIPYAMLEVLHRRQQAAAEPVRVAAWEPAAPLAVAAS